MGGSAGAMSVALHMLVDVDSAAGDTQAQPLFRGAVMHGGSPLPWGDLAAPTPQVTYDRVVAHAGCADADAVDALAAFVKVEHIERRSQLKHVQARLELS